MSLTHAALKNSISTPRSRVIILKHILGLCHTSRELETVRFVEPTVF